jgi:hypothetical protein
MDVKVSLSADNVCRRCSGSKLFRSYTNVLAPQDANTAA